MGKNLAKVKHTFYTCDGGSCRKARAEQTSRDTRAYIRNSGNWENTHTIKTRCNGRCEDAPTWIVQPGNYWYKNVNSKTGVNIIKSHVKNNQPLVDSLLFEEGSTKVCSENERSNSFIKPFEHKELPSGNKGWITKGLSSDQYLYALFIKWCDSQVEGIFTNRIGEKHPMSSLKTIDYTDEFTIELNFEGNTETLLIGAVGANDKTEKQRLKIRGTFYYTEENTENKGIIFKNKIGEKVASMEFKCDRFWKYCEEIQLGGIRITELA
ncbi:MAG: hypothetical protein MK105_04190 [Crocinitomicaceae bacterium]|nr:hypothetical protein [Crocinitomicaceae bacterium]